MAPNKSHILAAAIGATLAAPLGIALKAAISPASAMTAVAPMHLMWTDEGGGRSPRLVFTPTLSPGDGGTTEQTEVECNLDGTVPQIHNRVIARDDSMIAFCASLAQCASGVAATLPGAIPTITAPVVLADMAHVSTVDAGQ